MSELPFIRLIAWYAALAFIMVVAKFLESPNSGGDGYTYVANILGLDLLLPWIFWLPSGSLGQGVNTPLGFLCLSLLNLGLLVLISLLLLRLRRDREPRA